MLEVINKDITFDQFSKGFNEAVKRFRKYKCKSLEFIPEMYGNVHDQWFIGALRMTNMRGVNLYPIERYGVIVGILFLKKPCDKFNQLMSWIDKYGYKNFDCDHIETKLYIADVCGKRGRWSKEDERRKEYLCHSDKWCDRAKKQLQKIRTTGDRLEVSMETVEDFENMEDSIRNETELYGCVTRTLHFKVITPGGKVKMDSVIY